MDLDKALIYIENSFLSSLLKDENITDISFNGEKLFYLHNSYGRKESNIVVETSEIKDFIRQIANLTEKQFSFQTPILDVSVGKYRINAVHQSIGRFRGLGALTFSIRIASFEPKITDESTFLTPELASFFEVLISSGVSLVIGGTTGSGKTEFQKYLLRKIRKGTRVIIIDNVLELEQIRSQTNLDINTWQVDERNNVASIQNLVRNALRSNPDWLIVAEARGAEMIEILNSAMTGHPIITTIHAIDADSMLPRMASMILMNDKKMSSDEICDDIKYHLRFCIYVCKEETDGVISRYVSQITYLAPNSHPFCVYERKNNQHFYQKLPKTALNLLKIDFVTPLFQKTFMEEIIHE